MDAHSHLQPDQGGVVPALVDPEARKLIASDTELRQAKDVVDDLSAGDLEAWVATRSTGTAVRLPHELSALVTAVLETIARGGTVTVGSMPEDITTTTAADLLGVSRPTLMKMLSRGELPAHRVGSHTRLKSSDVTEFKRARLARQRKAFEELLELEDQD
jgi:excisionase family DNA binding protein